jgi:hypothetical protein
MGRTFRSKVNGSPARRFGTNDKPAKTPAITMIRLLTHIPSAMSIPVHDVQTLAYLPGRQENQRIERG